MKRFCLPVNGVIKELFKVNETPNSDNRDYLDLNISSLGFRKTFLLEDTNQSFSTLLSNENYDSYRQVDTSSHISVHCNPGKESVTIKRTIALKDGKDKTMVQVTPGIKRDKLFVPILFRICGNLDDDIFNLKSEENVILIGHEYNPSKDQLRLMLILSDVGVKFHYDIEHPSNMTQCQFSNFNLTILHSYLNFPAQKQTINITPITQKEQYNSLHGLEWWEIYNFYTDLNMAYAHEYFDKFGWK